MLLQNKLTAMKGKSFLYKSQEHTVINFKIIDETVHLVTDSAWLEFPVASAEAILSRNFLPVENEVGRETESTTPVIYEEIKKANVTSMLVESLQSIKAGTADVKVVKSMNETVRTLLEVAKTEVLIRKVNGKENK